MPYAKQQSYRPCSSEEIFFKAFLIYLCIKVCVPGARSIWPKGPSSRPCGYGEKDFVSFFPIISFL